MRYKARLSINFVAAFTPSFIYSLLFDSSQLFAQSLHIVASLHQSTDSEQLFLYKLYNTHWKQVHFCLTLLASFFLPSFSSLINAQKCSIFSWKYCMCIKKYMYRVFSWNLVSISEMYCYTFTCTMHTIPSISGPVSW